MSFVPLSQNEFTPLSRVSLNSETTNVILDSDEGNSSFVVKTGTQPSLYIDKNANVGINTSAPQSQLHVVGVGSAKCLRLQNSASGDAVDINVYADGSLILAPNAVGAIVSTSSRLNTTGLMLNNELITSSATQLNYTNTTPGVAEANKALVADATRSITNIQSVEASTLTGVIQTQSQTNITTVGTLTDLMIDGDLVVNGTVMFNGGSGGGGSIMDAIGYVMDQTIGTAAASKSLVLDSNLDIIGINKLGAATVSIGNTTLSEMDASYIDNVTPGASVPSKAVVADSNNDIAGINSLTATTLTGTLASASQPNITSVGVLSSLTTGSTRINSTTDATDSTHGGALTVDGGLAVTKRAFIGSDLTVNGDLFVNGTTTTINSTTIEIDDNVLALNAAPSGSRDSGFIVSRYQTSNDASTGDVVADAPSHISMVVSATATTVTIADGAELSGYYSDWWIKLAGGQIRQVTTYDHAMKQITIASELTSIPSAGSTISLYNKSYAAFVWSETNRTFIAAYTAADSPSDLTIIDEADLRAANVTTSGAIHVLDVAESSSPSTGALVVDGGAAVAKNLHVGGEIHGAVATAGQPNITSLGVLSSLEVDGNITGTLATADQPNITHVGTLASLVVTGDVAVERTAPNDDASVQMINSADGVSVEVGIRGSTSATNPSTMFFAHSGQDRMLINSSGSVIINATTDEGYKLNVGGSINADAISVNGVALATNVITVPITAGIASADKVLTVNADLNVAGINALSSTNIHTTTINATNITASNFTGTITTQAQPNITSIGTVDSITFGSTPITENDISPIVNATKGTVSASKAVIADAQKNISGLRTVGVHKSEADSDSMVTLSNASTSGSTVQSWVTDSKTMKVGATGSTHATAPDQAFVTFNNNDILRASASGEVAIGTDSFGYQMNVAGPINATQFYQNHSPIDLSAVSRVSGITEGVATASKAVTLDGNKSVAGLSSLSTNTITIGDTQLTGTDTATIAGVTPGTASASKALITDSNNDIGGINSFSTEQLFVGGSDIADVIAASVTVLVTTPGVATASKALIIDENKSVAGINNIGVESISVGAMGGVSITGIEAGYIAGVVPGAASASKAVVLDASRDIANVNSITTSALTVNGSNLLASHINYLSGNTIGSAAATKALVVDSNKSIAGLNEIGISSAVFDTATTTFNHGSGTATLSNMLLRAHAGRKLAIDYVGGNDLQFHWKDDDGVYQPRALLGNSGAYFSTGNFGIGRSSVPVVHKLDVNGSVNASSFYLNDSEINLVALDYVTGVTPGAASAGKALIFDASKDIGGVRRILLTGSASPLSMTNVNSSEGVEQSFISDLHTMSFGVRGSANATTPNAAFWRFNNADRLIMSSSGDISIGTADSLGRKLNVSGSVNAASYYLNNTAVDFSGLSYVTGATAGAVTASKAVIADSSKVISGLSSVGTDTIVVNGVTINSELSYIKSVTPGTSTAGKAMIVDANKSIAGINDISASSVTVGGAKLTATEANYLTSVAVGIVSGSKAIIADGASNVSGLNKLTASTVATSTLRLGTSSFTEATLGLLADVIPGKAAANKVLIVDAAKNISGINSLSATTLSGEIAVAEQPNITSVGTLSSLSVSGAVDVSSLTVDGFVIDASSKVPDYVRDILPGRSEASKSLVLDINKCVTGVSKIASDSIQIGQTPLPIGEETPTTAIAGLYISSSVNGIAVAPSITTLVMVGINSSVKYSTNGRTWTSVTNFPAGVSANITQFTTIEWSPNGFFVLIGDKPFNTGCWSLKSTNGITWTNLTNISVKCLSIEWSVSLGCFVGSAEDCLLKSSDGVTWTTTQIGYSYINDLCWVDELNKFILVGYGSALGNPIIASSEDGINVVTLVTNDAGMNLRSIAWSPELSMGVVVGNGLIAHSYNGIDWTINTSTRNYTRVIWVSPHNIFVAVCGSSAPDGFNVSVSADGVHWEYCAGGTLLYYVMYDSAFDQLLFIGGTQMYKIIPTIIPAPTMTANGNAISISSATLAIADATESTTPLIGSLTVAGGVGISKRLNVGGNVSMNGNLAINGNVSAAGLTCTSLTATTTSFSNLRLADTTPSLSSQTGALIVGGGAGIGGNANVLGNVVVGNTLTVTNPLPYGSIEITASTPFAGTGIADAATTMMAYSPKLRLFVRSCVYGYIYVSTDGITWTSVSSGVLPNTINCVCWSPTLEMFVAIASVSKVLYSTTGYAWTLVNTTNSAEQLDIKWSTSLGRFLSVGVMQTLTSTNGISWTKNAIDTLTNYAALCSAENLSTFIVVGSDTRSLGAAVILTTNDGITFTPRYYNPNASAMWLTSVAWSSTLSMGVAVGTSIILYSRDAINWTPIIVDRTYNQVIWSEALGLFIAVNASTVDSMNALISPNGINWTLAANDNTINISTVVVAPELNRIVFAGQIAGSSNHRTQYMNATPIKMTIAGGVAITNKLTVGAGARVGGDVNISGTLLVNGIDITNGATVPDYVIGINPGAAVASKAVVLDESKNVTGINSLSVASLTVSGAASVDSLTVNGTALTNAPSYVLSITPGIAAVSKALVLDASSNISGIGALSATTLNGTIGTGDQTGITSVGTLGSLTVSGPAIVTGDVTVSGQLTVGGNAITSVPTYAVSIEPGTASVSKALVLDTNGDISGIGSLSATSLTATSLTGTLTSPLQTNITSVGTLDSLSVTGDVSCTNIAGKLTSPLQTNITSVGTLDSLSVTGDVSCTNIAGKLTSPLQTNITSVGALDSLDVTGTVTANMVSINGQNIVDDTVTTAGLVLKGNLYQHQSYKIIQFVRDAANVVNINSSIWCDGLSNLTLESSRGEGNICMKTNVVTAGNTIFKFSDANRVANLIHAKANGSSGPNIGLDHSSPTGLLHLGRDNAIKPNGGSWTTSSDVRLKEDIVDADIQVCYDNIKNVRLARYKWRDDIYTEDQVSDRRKLGWIAQEVEAVFPKAVSSVEAFGIEDCRTLNADQIYASMYGAVQCLMQKVETLEATSLAQAQASSEQTRALATQSQKIAALEATVASQAQKISALEGAMTIGAARLQTLETKTITYDAVFQKVRLYYPYLFM